MDKLLFTFIAIMTIAFIYGCSDDNPCDNPGEGENFVLSDSIKAFIANYEDAERVIFKTADEDEVIFDVSTIQDVTVNYQFVGICEEDPSDTQVIMGSAQTNTLTLSNPDEVPEPIYISLREFPVPPENMDVQEVTFVTLGALGTNSFQQEDALLWIYPSVDIEDVIFHDSLEIRETTFYAVYELDSPGTSTRYDIKYSMDQGVIFIKDPISGRELVYERKE